MEPIRLDASSEVIASSAAQNLQAHMTYAQRRTAGMRVESDAYLTVTDSGLPTDTFNTVCCARLGPPEVTERISAVVEHFRGAKRPFSWWVGPADRPPDLGAALTRAGLRVRGTEVAMAANLDQLAPIPPEAGGLHIERVTDAGQLAVYARLLGGLEHPPGGAVIAFYEATVRAFLDSSTPLRPYLGFIGTVPVATAELALAGGVAGLYNISTAEAYRGRGIGSAMTLRLLLDARKADYHVGVLQAAEASAGVYRRVGFGNVGTYEEYGMPEG